MLKIISKYFGRSKGEPVEFYCQTCGDNITENGGDVGNVSVYCHGYKEDSSRCLDSGTLQRIMNGDFSPAVFNFLNAGQVQRAIKRGQINNYGPLEDSVS